MRPPKIIRDKRGDISSPIILVLITVAALAVAGIVVVWMSTTASRAANTGALVVLGSPIVSGNTVIIGIKNLGSQDATISNATLTVNTVYYASSISPSTIVAGSTASVTITLSGSPPITSGQGYSGAILTNQGTLLFTAVAQ
ncbi:MAG: hypothetical protein QXG08_01175 [Candidatus Methanomethyliaceae archaeon]